MKKKGLILAGLVTVFFFAETAITFSEKGNPYLIANEEIAFSLKLENRYSDYPGTSSVDDYVKEFMDRWGIEGASVAITRNEELVYARGFGYADREAGETVKPGHLFRIASVSKLITAVAVMKLVEEDKIRLDEKVFGPDGILDTTMFPDYKDPRVENITVSHLMNHTAGWSRRSGDPLFKSLYIARKMKIPPPAGLDNIIEYTLSRKLNYAPGSRYSYSNLGYAILGKIIEKKSGMPYEDYVIMYVLKPLGIHDMHIGKSFFHERYPNEVTYYTRGKERKIYSIDGSGELVPVTYGGNNIELLGAAGGWVASAPELIKFLTAIDGYSRQPDILTPQSLENMSDPDIAGRGLYGWRGNDGHGTLWRTGYLTGSTALVVKQYNHTNWVILFNTSTYKQSRIQRYMSGMMFQAVNSIQDWPDFDLFMVDQMFPQPIRDIPSKNPKL